MKHNLWQCPKCDYVLPLDKIEEIARKNNFNYVDSKCAHCGDESLMNYVELIFVMRGDEQWMELELMSNRGKIRKVRLVNEEKTDELYAIEDAQNLSPFGPKIEYDEYSLIRMSDGRGNISHIWKLDSGKGRKFSDRWDRWKDSIEKD